MQVGRNSPCPCGTKRKYKHCCLGKVDWERLLDQSFSHWVPYLSPRGRNVHFMNAMFAALQLETETPKNWAEFKRAFTPRAVQRIHEAVFRLWPPDTDITRVLGAETDIVRGLYVGIYEPEPVARAVSRHCLYADRVVLVDPFVYAPKIRPEYNPMEYPEHYLQDTIRWAKIWLQFLPWIDSGLVEFIRTPGDFDPRLFHDLYRAERARFESDPELKQLVEEWADNQRDTPEYEQMKRQALLLTRKDEDLEELIKDFDPQVSEDVLRGVLRNVQREREEHAYHVDMVPDRHGKLSQIHMMTTGMGHLESRLSASLMHGYLVTDLVPRWRMIEKDREYEKVDQAKWSPLAKAFGEVQLRYLDGVTLADALRLRREDRLEEMRGFLRRVYKASESDSPYSESVARDMSAELSAQAAEADTEWNGIDRDLLRWSGAEIAAAGVGVVTGGVSWVAAGLAAATAGVFNLAASTWQRRDFYKSMPAAFFMDLRRRQKVDE